MEQLKSDLKIIQTEFEEMKEQLKEIHFAVVGSSLTNGQGGLIRRVEEAEEEIVLIGKQLTTAKEGFEKRMAEKEKEQIEKEKAQIKLNIQTKIIWTLGTATATLIIGYILGLIFHK
jgi:hypothetical protein